MFKIIVTFIIAIMAFATTAQADARISATTRYVLDTTPVPVTVAEAHRCAQAYHNGGTYRLMTSEVTLTCTERQIRREWDPSQN